MQGRGRHYWHLIISVLYMIGALVLWTRSVDGAGVAQSEPLRLVAVSIWTLFWASIVLIELVIQFWSNVLRHQNWGRRLVTPAVILGILILIQLLVSFKLKTY